MFYHASKRAPHGRARSGSNSQSIELHFDISTKKKTVLYRKLLQVAGSLLIDHSLNIGPNKKCQEKSSNQKAYLY
jgi:hypothetical protein